jgi:hypothetical protein
LRDVHVATRVGVVDHGESDLYFSPLLYRIKVLPAVPAGKF